MLVAFAFVVLQAIAPCHVGAAPRGGTADVQRLIESAWCASGQLRIAGEPARPAGDGREGSPSASLSGCLHCVGVRDGLAAATGGASWRTRIDAESPTPRAAAEPVPHAGARAAAWPRGPPVQGLRRAC
jgi:hypothetical protein